MIAIRNACDSDAGQLIRIMDDVFAEYPGCVLDVDAEEPDLRAIATAYDSRNGRFWVAEKSDGRIVGMVGCRPMPDSPHLELKKLYIERAARGAGLGTHLVGLVEDEARRRGSAGVELWSDTRFGDAHRLYERLGYVRLDGTRALYDLSNSIEYHYLKRL